jgi:TrmH family RNA methyltransferase
MILTSPKNEWIRQIRLLHHSKGRREQELFLIEGTHLLQEALSTQWPLRAVCYTEKWLAAHPYLVKTFSHQTRQQLVSMEVLASLATTETPDGVIAVAQMASQRVHTRDISLGVAVESLQDPGNLGTLIRTAAAVGCDGLWVSRDSVDPYHPKVLRSSAGQWFRLQPCSVEPLSELIDSSRQKEVQIVATGVGSGTLYWEQDFRKPTLFLLGNEGAGLSPNLLSQADALVTIPMQESVDSLNAGVAGALLLYEAKRQRLYSPL